MNKQTKNNKIQDLKIAIEALEQELDYYLCADQIMHAEEQIKKLNQELKKLDGR